MVFWNFLNLLSGVWHYFVIVSNVTAVTFSLLLVVQEPLLCFLWLSHSPWIFSFYFCFVSSRFLSSLLFSFQSFCSDIFKLLEVFPQPCPIYSKSPMYKVSSCVFSKIGMCVCMSSHILCVWHTLSTCVHPLQMAVLLNSFCCSVARSYPTLFDSMDCRLLCPSLSPRACSDSCPLSQWCHLTTHPLPPSSPFTFSLSQHQGLFQWVGSSHQVGGQSIGASASALVLPMKIQDWYL